MKSSTLKVIAWLSATALAAAILFGTFVVLAHHMIGDFFW